jgi:hypothetical protein
VLIRDVVAGLAVAADRAGHGVEFDWKAFEAMRA